MSAPKPFPKRPLAPGNGSVTGNQPRPIELENIDAGTVHRFSSGKDASAFTGLTPAAISQLRNKRRYQAHCPSTDCTWRLPGVESPSGWHGRRTPGGQPKAISLRCIETGEVFHYSSHQHACRDQMIEPTALHRLASGVCRTYRGLRLA